MSCDDLNCKKYEDYYAVDYDENSMFYQCIDCKESDPWECIYCQIHHEFDCDEDFDPFDI